MTTDVVQKTTRGVSPLLLVLAGLCFLLPFAGVSCNTAAAQSALGPALQSLGGASGAQSAQATQCIQSLSNRDLATYSGFSLAFGGNPNADTSNLPGCDAGNTSSTATSSDQGNIGVQPLVLIAFILIIVGVLATVVKAPVRSIVGGGAALIALLLLVISNTSVHTPIINKLSSSSGAGSLSQIGITGGLGGFFDIHAGIGFVLVMVVLVAAVVVNAAGAFAGLRLRVATAAPAAPPPGTFNWPSAPGPGSGPAPPPSPPA